MGEARGASCVWEKMVLFEKDDAVGNANYALTIDNQADCTGAGVKWNVMYQLSGGAAESDCYAPGVAISTGTWYHVVGTFDGSTLKVYVNGVWGASAAAVFTPTTGTGVLMLGNEAGNSFYFNGTLDEVRIYNRALNASEVRSLMLGFEPGEY